MKDFRQSDRKDSQNLNIDTFCRLSVNSVQAFVGTEKYPDAGILRNYDDDDDYTQGFSRNKEAFKVLTKKNILELNITPDKFGS